MGEVSAMVILHIMNYGAAYRGNFIESLECLNTELKKNGGRNIYLFTAEANNAKARPWINDLKEKGEKVYFLTGNTKNDCSIILKIAKEESVTAIHSHFISMEHFLAIRRANRRLKLHIYMHMHNHSTEARNPIKNILRRWIYKDCYMIACSESVYKSLERDYPTNKKTFIDNGVFFERLDKYKLLSDAEYGVTPGDIKLLIFGFDYFRKGVDLAVDALRKLRDEGENYTLLISLSTNFEKVEENIKSVLGEMPDWIKIIPARNDVASLYNYVDVFLSPSREEGLPYSVIEAAYCNCAVVMSDISAQRYLKVPFGIWCENNADSLKKAIISAVDIKKDKISNMEQVHNDMRLTYSLEKWKNEVIHVYQNSTKDELRIV